MYVKKITNFCQELKKMHTKENWFLFFWFTEYTGLAPKSKKIESRAHYAPETARGSETHGATLHANI